MIIKVFCLLLGVFIDIIVWIMIKLSINLKLKIGVEKYDICIYFYVDEMMFNLKYFW